jgi:phage terminase small subunit
MRTASKPRAPQHVRAETRAWFSSVLTDYVLEPHHIRLLTLAAESFDRCTQAREAIAAEGMTIETGKGGLKAHPCVAVERDAIGIRQAHSGTGSRR